MANDKQVYTALTAIGYDNKRYAAGKPIALDDDAAAELLAIGAVEKAVEPKKGDKK